MVKIFRCCTSTNDIESVNSSLRKAIRKWVFPNENSVLKLLYLRVMELQKKWNGKSVVNWAIVRNKLDIYEKFQKHIRKYQ